MPLARVTGVGQRVERALSGTPDMLLTAIILGVAALVAYLAFRLPPSAKPALLAYVVLP
jgi:hypothetical protein